MELRNCPLAELRQAENHPEVVVWTSINDGEASKFKLDNGTIVWMCEVGQWKGRDYVFIEAVSHPEIAGGWVAFRNLKSLRPASRPVICLELPE